MIRKPTNPGTVPSILKTVCTVAVLIAASVPAHAFAEHQPLLAAEAVIVEDPQAPKAYYGKLEGERHVYHFESSEPFRLRVRLLVPDSPDSKKDVMAALMQVGFDQPLAVLDGGNAPWVASSEQGFVGRTYLEGPSFDDELAAGIYEMRVWSSNNDSEYGLLFGGSEDAAAAREYPTALCIFISTVIAAFVIWGIVAGMRRRRERLMAESIIVPAESPLYAPAPTEEKRAPETIPKTETKPPFKDTLSKETEPPQTNPPPSAPAGTEEEKK